MQKFDYLVAIKQDAVDLKVIVYNQMPAKYRKYHLAQYFVYMPASGWRPVRFVK